MKKFIFYWYVTDIWHFIYDIHAECLKYYFKIWKFDSVDFIVSYDDDKQDTEYLQKITYTVNLLKSICNYCNIVYVKNNKEFRESAYFYEGIYKKLNEYNDDDCLFFCHAKGVNSTYMNIYDLLHWINLLYFGTLFYKDKIQEFFDDDRAYCAGSLIFPEYEYHSGLNCEFFKQPYKWHYSGTFFWMKPKKIYNHIIKNDIHIPECNRFFDEAFFGYIFPNNKIFNKDTLNYVLDGYLTHSTYIKTCDVKMQLDYYKFCSEIYSNLCTNKYLKNADDNLQVEYYNSLFDKSTELILNLNKN